MPLESSHSILESNGGLALDVSGLCYDVDGTPCGFDRVTVGPVAFYSMDELENCLSINVFSGVWAALADEAKRLRVTERENIAELRRWLDKRRNG